MNCGGRIHGGGDQALPGNLLVIQYRDDFNNFSNRSVFKLKSDVDWKREKNKTIRSFAKSASMSL